MLEDANLPIPRLLTAETWGTVLADIDELLRGDLLLSHWPLGGIARISLVAAMHNPPEIDFVGIFQGETISPYAKRGTPIDWAFLRQFRQMAGATPHPPLSP